MDERRRRARRTLALLGLTALVLSPSATVVWLGAAGGSASLWSHYARTVLTGYTANTLVVTAWAIATAWLLGLVPAWLTHAYDFRGKTLLTYFQALALTLPAHVTAGIYLEFLGDDFASSRVLLGALLGAATAPYLFLLTRAALARVPRVLVDAARCLGARTFRRQMTLHARLIAPTVLIATTLVAAEAISDYGAASRIAVKTLSVGLTEQWSALQRHDVAMFLALLTSVVALSLVVPIASLAFILRTPVWKPGPATDAVPLRGMRATCAAVTCVAAAVPGFFAPLAYAAYWSVNALERVDLSTLYRDVGSTLFTATGILVLVALAALALVAAARVGARLGRSERLLALTSLNYLLPALVLSFAILRMETVLPVLGGSRLPVVLAAAARLSPLLLLPVLASLAQASAQLIETARTLGASPWSATRRVLLPTLAPTLIFGGALVLIEGLKELTMSANLQPFGYSSLSLRIFSFSDLHLMPEASIWTICLVGVALFPLWMALGAATGGRHARAE